MGRLVARAEPYAFSGLPPGTHLGMPSANLTLVITLDERIELSGGPVGPAPRRLEVSIAGLHSQPVVIRHEGRMRGLQLDLTPGGCRALLGCPAGELAERVEEGDAVLGSIVGRMREQLHEVAAAGDQLSFVASVLGGAARARPMDERLARAWHRLTSTHGLVSIADLAEDAGWSPRHFTERFTKEFGLGPKTTARVLRFGRSRAMLRHGVPAVEVAGRCGYADQAHLVREWRRLAGTTPGRWPQDDALAFVQDTVAGRGEC